MLALRRLFRSPQSIPQEHRSNFLHWYFDIFWFGVLNGSTLIFLGVYMTRLGGTVEQLALLSAAPAVMNLIFTFPAGMIGSRLPTWLTTRWSALITRVFYLLLAPLPWFLDPQANITVIIIIVFVMNIPGTLQAVVGNAFFAETVPDEYRAQVVGTRNALLSVTTMLISFLVGVLLNRFPAENFVTGYQYVFLIGFIGAALSTVHLFFIRPVKNVGLPPLPLSTNPEVAQEDLVTRPSARMNLRTDVLTRSYLIVLMLMFWFHLSVFTPGPIFTVYQVRVLNMSDQVISLGTVVFWLMHFIGSTQVAKLSRRLSYKTMTGIGIFFITGSNFVFAFSTNFWIYSVCQTLAGLGWSLIGGGQINYMLQCVPANDRPAHLAWYNIALNAAILLAAILGPQLAGRLGLLAGLIVAVGMRLLAGILLMKFGNLREAAPVPCPSASLSSLD